MFTVNGAAQLTPGEYLETALQPVRGTGRSVDAKNAVCGELINHLSHSCVTSASTTLMALTVDEITLSACAAAMCATDNFAVALHSHYTKVPLKEHLTHAYSCTLAAQIRESIKTLFPARECFALVRPMSDEKQLQRLEAVPAAQLRPEFRQARATWAPLRAPCSCLLLCVCASSCHLRPIKS